MPKFKFRVTVTDEIRAGITEMFLAGLPWRTIDETYNLSSNYARRLVQRWGILEAQPPEVQARIKAAYASRDGVPQGPRHKPFMQTPPAVVVEMPFGDPPPGRSALDQKRKAGLI